MHGGARGSGAPAGNANALKYGLYTKEMVERRQAIAQLIRNTEGMLVELE